MRPAAIETEFQNQLKVPELQPPAGGDGLSHIRKGVRHPPVRDPLIAAKIAARP